jgi:rare lipoprotein A
MRRRDGALAAVALALSLGAGLAAPAHAASLADRRLQAARLVHQVDLLDAQLAAWGRRYDVAAARLAGTRRRMALERRLLHIAVRSQRRRQAALAALLVRSYKQGSGDVTAYVLASGSFQDLVNRVDVVDRLSSAEGDLITQIRAARRAIAVRRRRLAREAAGEQRALAAARDARAELHARVAQRERTLAGVRGEIARLVRAAEARRARAAREAAQQASAQADAAQPQPAGAAVPDSPASRAVYYGEGTWYGPGFEGSRTASGEMFDPDALAAASPWLPFGTHVRVTDLDTGAAVVVRINDRGPFGGGIIDLTPRAARAVGLSGVARVRLEVL